MDLNKEINSKQELYVEEELMECLDRIEKIIDKSNYQEYGVRKLCKQVRKKIENNIINSVFS